jgi:tRNA (guanine37-N1)-methyltransferase
MKFKVLTLYPEMFESVFAQSIIARARQQDLLQIETGNIRSFAEGRRRNVDDRPFGGGEGMLLGCGPLFKAIENAKKELGSRSKVVFFTPQGKTFKQKTAQKFAKQKDNLILLCGHFEGIDERVRVSLVDEEISMGDFVLTGGEIPAMAFIDAVGRLLPGVVGKEASITRESFSDQLFFQQEYPQYTRPAEFRGMQVPKVLLSGNHGEIERWQLENLRNLDQTEKKILNARLDQLPFKSKNLRFRLPRKEDIDFWYSWMNDAEVTRFLKSVNPPVTRQTQESFFQQVQKNLYNIYFAIEFKRSKKIIGGAILHVDPLNPQKGKFSFHIGEKDYWGKGLGTEILREVVCFGFENLGLQKINSSAFSDNLASIRVHEKVGFKKVGIRKQEFWKNGELCDQVLLEIYKN